MIIGSLLDTDFYILTMMKAVYHHYTDVPVKFEFCWRNWDKMNLNISIEQLVNKVNAELDDLCTLRFLPDEITYLSKIPFLSPDFIEYLRLFQLNRGYIHAYEKNGQLAIEITGPLLNVIMFEVPVLATVSQIYSNHNNEMGFNWLQAGRKKLNDKLNYLLTHIHKDTGFSFADFGTRRRANAHWHREIVDTILSKCPHLFAGTSNVLLAKEYNIKYIGTMAHLWFQVHQQLNSRLVDSQKVALQTWADEYRGELGIALTDTLGFDMFLKDFDRYFALLFDGCRHDSGDPFDWLEKLIGHYIQLRIDPKTKIAVFSDGLTFEVATQLFQAAARRIKTSFGIGTYLTNDCGFLAPQIVIKNTETNGRPTAKISDSPGKGMCKDPEFEAYLKKVVKERING